MSKFSVELSLEVVETVLCIIIIYIGTSVAYVLCAISILAQLAALLLLPLKSRQLLSSHKLCKKCNLGTKDQFKFKILQFN